MLTTSSAYGLPAVSARETFFFFENASQPHLRTVVYWSPAPHRVKSEGFRERMCKVPERQQGRVKPRGPKWAVLVCQPNPLSHVHAQILNPLAPLPFKTRVRKGSQW